MSRSIKVRAEHGYEQGLEGLSFNKKKEGNDMSVISKKLACVGGGHDQWMRQVMVWVDVNMPLTFWKQFDKYNFVIASCQEELMPDWHLIVTQSESTMHTLHQEDLSKDMFSHDVWEHYLDHLNEKLNGIRNFKGKPVEKKRLLEDFYDALPMGYLQKRKITLSYAQIATIFAQRKAHKLLHWRYFIKELYEQLEHPELFEKIFAKGKKASKG